jgi:hypothetical protein
MMAHITIEGMLEYSNASAYKWEFVLPKDILVTAKKLAAIETEEVVTLYTTGDVVKLGEVSKWGIEICPKTPAMTQMPLNFSKRHLSNINCFGDNVIWRMRDGFFYVQDSVCMYLFSYETNFEDYD